MKMYLAGSDFNFMGRVEDLLILREIDLFLNKDDMNILVIPYAINLKNIKKNQLYKFFSTLRRSFELMSAVVKNHNLIVADNSVENLWPYLNKADVIYVPGGDGDMLYDECMKRGFSFDGINTNNKVYMGNSAGANLLSVKYYSNDNKKVCDGMGYNGINTMCHYNSSKFNQLNELIKASNGTVLPINDEEVVTLNYVYN